VATGTGGTAGGGGVAAGGSGGGTGGGGTGGSALGGSGGGGGLVGGGTAADCGNGATESGEDCDDGNLTPDDGCTGCLVDAGYTCSGQPSLCQPIAAQEITLGPALGIPIPDGQNHYDGTLATMACVPVAVPDLGFHSIQRVELTVAVAHPYVGDLIVKLQSPQATVTTVLSRPGVSEPADSYYSTNGDSSELVASHPVHFRDDAVDDAETMGNTINGNAAVCRDDQRCDYVPNSGAGIGTGLADFVGQNPVGTWQVCFGDGYEDDTGTLDAVILSVLSW